MRNGVTGGLPVEGTAAAQAQASQAEVLRVLDLTPGQQVQGTVVARLSEGVVQLGILGARVEALTNLVLEIGKTYSLEVSSTQPRLVLTTSRALRLPSRSVAAAAGRLGTAAPELGRLVLELLAVASASAPQPSGASTPGPDDMARAEPGQEELARIFQRLQQGRITGPDLRVLLASLGHDQEARVLHLALSPSRRRAHEVLRLQRSLKAEALTLAEEPTPAQAGKREAVRAARRFVSGMNGIELDNAHRAEQGVPLLLPLPVPEGGPLQDLRLFVQAREEEDDQGAASVSDRFTIVLLLDLTRLGEVRVDLELASGRLTVKIQAVETATVELLRGALPDLRSALEEGELLSLRSLTLRQAKGQGLPVADLLSPPRPGRPDSLLDVHA